MNVASLELCKGLYELSGWEDTYLMYDEKRDRSVELATIGTIPAYDLGYLLRKLATKPINLVQVWSKALLTLPGGEYERSLWVTRASNGDSIPFASEAESPENATCNLAIELFEQGVLTKRKS